MNLFNVYHLGIKFLNPGALWLIPLVLVVVGVLYWRAKRRRRRFLSALLGPRADSPDHVMVSYGRRALRIFLFCIALVLLVVAIARPYWGYRIIPCENRGRDVMVLFDVSKSMLATDLKPDRLEHAKWLVRQLVTNSFGDRFGLIAFAGRAFLECPLTTDKTSFFNYLDELDTSTIPVGGTNLQLALEAAVDAFKAAEGGNRAVLLLTDGEELSGNSKAVLSALKAKNIPLFIVGIGDPKFPAPIPLDQKADGSIVYKRDSQGNMVKTKLNEEALKTLAEQSGGMYVRSTAVNAGLAEVTRAIKGLVPANIEKGTMTEPIERFYWPLAFALILLSFWFIISERGSSRPRRGGTVSAAALLVCFGIIGSGDVSAQQVIQPPEQPLMQKQPEAQSPDGKNEADKKKEKKVSVEKLYNTGLELQKKNQPQAKVLYEKAIAKSAKKPEIRGRAFQNMGVDYHRKALGEVNKSLMQVKQQNLDGALKQLDVADQELNKAEEFYVEAMTNAALAVEKKPLENDQQAKTQVKKSVRDEKALVANIDKTAINQQILLRDRKQVAELRKKIKELKKKQEEARKKAEQAKKQQQKENQQKQQKQQQQQNKQPQNKQNKQDQQQQQNKQQKNQQQKQDQQNKQPQNKQNKQDQQQKENQQKPQNQQQKQDQQNKQQQKQQQKQDQQSQQPKNAKQALDQARKAVDELQKQAKDLQQKKLEDQAKKAKQELDKAKDEQKKDAGKKAEDHIKKALEYLDAQSKNQQNKDKNKDKKNKQGGGKDKDKKKDQQKPDKGKDQQKKLPKPAQGAQARPQQKDIDPKQARAILRKMAEKEKNLRDAIKAHRKQVYKNITVEKDW